MPPKPSHLTIADLFPKNAQQTFLVGAGCSVDAPSCLPAGRAAMKAIIEFACADSEKAKILGLKELRFEQLVEIVRDQLDPELKVIDYYGQCDKPNLQHFFLADAIKKGHVVMTTNFDYLIELALVQSGVRKEDVVPVITRNNFEYYSNPAELFKIGKKAVYKIHGSSKNVITGEDAKGSLVATIQAFGSNKKGLNAFQIEPFKKPLFDNASSGRSLVVMGYSGSNDFDVVPTLLALKNLNNIIWIDHVSNDGGIEKIDEIKSLEGNPTDKVDQILRDAKRTGIAKGVYRIQANTPKLLQTISKVEAKKDSAPFSLSMFDWLKKNVKSPTESTKLYVSNKIYFDFDMYDDSTRCSEAMLRLAEKENDQKSKSVALGYLGRIYDVKGYYPAALEQFEQALKITEQLGDLKEKAIALNNIGMIYGAIGDLPEALKRFEQALKITEQLGDLLEISRISELITKTSIKTTGSPKELLMRNVLSHNLGIAANENDRFIVVLPRFTPYPCIKEIRIFTSMPRQKEVYFKIYQGENEYAKQNQHMGDFHLSIEPRDSLVPIQVRFEIDLAGILKVAAKDIEMNQEANIVIKSNTTASMSEAEIQTISKRLEDIKEKTHTQKIKEAEKLERQYQINMGLQYYSVMMEQRVYYLYVYLSQEKLTVKDSEGKIIYDMSFEKLAIKNEEGKKKIETSFKITTTKEEPPILDLKVEGDGFEIFPLRGAVVVKDKTISPPVMIFSVSPLKTTMSEEERKIIKKQGERRFLHINIDFENKTVNHTILSIIVQPKHFHIDIGPVHVNVSKKTAILVNLLSILIGIASIVSNAMSINLTDKTLSLIPGFTSISFVVIFVIMLIKGIYPIKNKFNNLLKFDKVINR